MRMVFDTNILAYAEGVGTAARCDRTMEFIQQMQPEHILVPAQTLGELYRVLTLKAKRSPDDARSAVLQWADSYEIADSTWASFQAAFDLTVDHAIQIWDALILSLAAENHCRLLLSEDMHHGFTWRGLTVVNPYRTPIHPLLAAYLS